MGPLGFPELIIIGIIALLIFGPKKLPELGGSLGKSIRDFKSALNDKAPEEKPEAPETVESKAASQTPAPPAEQPVKKA